MAKTKTVSDEQIIAALLTTGTIKGTAAAVNLSERTIYDRMNDGDFKALYKGAKADLTRTAVFSINGQLAAAIQTVVDVMSNEENNAAVRLQAAQTIINSATKFANRLQEEEHQIDTQVWNNRFDI